MESWPVVEFGNLIEAECEVVVRTDPLRTIDGARLQILKNLTARQRDYGDAQPGQHFPALAGHTKFQTFEIVNRGDLLAKPTAHLLPGIAGEKCLDSE